MNLAGRIHLKNRMNSASSAPETSAECRRHAAPSLPDPARLVQARTSKTDLVSGLVPALFSTAMHIADYIDLSSRGQPQFVYTLTIGGGKFIEPRLPQNPRQSRC
jgi:hypothetical protein